MAVPTPTTRPRGVRVRTDLTSEAEFISAFQDLCDDNTIFAPTEKMKPIGASCAFSLELADGTPMVRGLGIIRNAWPMTDSPFGRPGIHIEIDQLTNSTEPIFQKMLDARLAAAAKPRTRPAPSTHQLWGAPAGPPTEEMLAQPEAEEPVLHKKITREIRGVDPLDLTDDARVDDESDTKEAQRYNDPPPNGTKVRPPTIPGAPVPRPRPRLASAPVATVAPPMGESNIDVDPNLLAPKQKPWWMNARVGAVFAGGIVLGLLFSLVFRSSPKPVAAKAAAVAQVEPPKCPPPPEPTALAAAEPEQDAPPEEPKAKAKARPAKANAKPKQVAAATKPATTKSTPVATKPATTATAKPTTTKTSTKTSTATVAKATPTTTKSTTTTAKPSTTATTKPSTTAVAAKTTTKPATTTTKAAPTTTKPSTSTSFASIKAATKPTTTAPTTKVASTKTAPTTTKKPKKGACSSLDCL